MKQMIPVSQARTTTESARRCVSLPAAVLLVGFWMPVLAAGTLGKPEIPLGMDVKVSHRSRENLAFELTVTPLAKCKEVSVILEVPEGGVLTSGEAAWAGELAVGKSKVLCYELNLTNAKVDKVRVLGSLVLSSGAVMKKAAIVSLTEPPAKQSDKLLGPIAPTDRPPKLYKAVPATEAAPKEEKQ